MEILPIEVNIGQWTKLPTMVGRLEHDANHSEGTMYYKKVPDNFLMKLDVDQAKCDMYYIRVLVK